MIRDYTYVIVGGGAATATAADAIRAHDATGSIAIFTREWAPPYQRPPLSKEFLRNEVALDTALMFPSAWYLEHDVALHIGIDVLAIDPARNVVNISSGDVGYHRLLLATGATPRALTIPGAALEGVYTLRSYLDAERLRGVRSSADSIVMIGSGFIGMEVAASLRSGGGAVTIVTPDDALYAPFGADVSGYARSLFDRHDVPMHFKSSVASIDGTDRVTGVTLTDGTHIATDTVVVGIGVLPDVALAEQAGLHIDNGIVVDDRLRSSAANVYAAGDVARFPGLDGKLMRVEHFDNAYASGAHAGGSMAGVDASYQYVPFFWSDVFELSFEFVGTTASAATIVTGTIESGSFVIEYRSDDRLVGALLAQRETSERDAYRMRLTPQPMGVGAVLSSIK
jgi:3-phenylpropionate/trans-cinnamate dioxygenase ferredoxin reductase subunit